MDVQADWRRMKNNLQKCCINPQMVMVSFCVILQDFSEAYTFVPGYLANEIHKIYITID